MPILYRKLDENGDYTFGQGKVDFYTGIDAVEQAIKTRLKLLQEEWWEDQEDGLPLFQDILGYSGSNKDAVDSLIRERIAGTEGVISVSDIESSYNSTTRQYSFTCRVETEYGTLALTNT